MLKALTKAVGDAGCTDLAGYRAQRQTRPTAGGHPSSAYVAAEHVADDPGRRIGAYTPTATPSCPARSTTGWRCSAASPATSASPSARTTPSSPSRPRRTSRPTTPILKPEDRTPPISGTPPAVPAVWAELCNECGNCMTFCPEDGDPAKVKPRLFTDPRGLRRTDRPGLPARGRQSATTAGPCSATTRRPASWSPELLAAEGGNPLGRSTDDGHATAPEDYGRVAASGPARSRWAPVEWPGSGRPARPHRPDEPRSLVVDRLIALLDQAAEARGRTGGLPRAGAHHLLPPLVHRGPRPATTTTTRPRCRARDHAAVR